MRLINNRLSRDFCHFREDYWEFPKDIGGAKIFEKDGKKNLLITSGENTTFRCEEIEVFHI